ncbi:MAG: recombination protein RecR [Chlamydiia bacterium]|nr:recombination protein RecR [Chlamydiia bacterium]
MHYPEHLQKLILLFKKFPGVGTRSAERFAFHLLDWPEEKLLEIGKVFSQTKEKLTHCTECGVLIEEKCPFCTHPTRLTSLLCLVASPKDVFSIEQTHAFNGLYHVLGGVLSPLQGLSPPADSIKKLKNRIKTLEVKEIILALDSTLEGDTTALYLKKELESLHITASRLALGLPMGSSLDFIDGGTLARALAGRQAY